MAKHLCFCALLLPAIPVLSAGQSQVVSEIRGLMADEPLSRQKAFLDLRRDRKERVQGLIEVLTSAKNGRYLGPKHYAVDLLGELRAEEAVEIFLDREYFRLVPEGFETDEMIETQMYYRCAWALKKIGYPAIGRLIATKIGFFSTTTEDLELAAWIVMRIEGKEQAVYRFDRMAGDSFDSRYRNNMAKAAEYLRTFTPSFTAPKEEERVGKPPVLEGEEASVKR